MEYLYYERMFPYLSQWWPGGVGGNPHKISLNHCILEVGGALSLASETQGPEWVSGRTRNKSVSGCYSLWIFPHHSFYVSLKKKKKELVEGNISMAANRWAVRFQLMLLLKLFLDNSLSFFFFFFNFLSLGFYSSEKGMVSNLCLHTVWTTMNCLSSLEGRTTHSSDLG